MRNLVENCAGAGAQWDCISAGWSLARRAGRQAGRQTRTQAAGRHASCSRANRKLDDCTTHHANWVSACHLACAEARASALQRMCALNANAGCVLVHVYWCMCTGACVLVHVGVGAEWLGVQRAVVMQQGACCWPAVTACVSRSKLQRSMFGAWLAGWLDGWQAGWVVQCLFHTVLHIQAVPYCTAHPGSTIQEPSVGR
jgi:hypothetical protein